MNTIISKRGFSLIELLVALSILAVVAAIIVPRFLNVRDNAADTVADAQVKALNNVYANWIALGGNLNGASLANTVDFLSRLGSTATRGRGLNTDTGNVTANIPYDSTGNFGSGTVSFSGISVSSGSATAASGDGIYTGNSCLKIGNRYYVLTFAPTAATPFTKATAVTTAP